MPPPMILPSEAPRSTPPPNRSDVAWGAVLASVAAHGAVAWLLLAMPLEPPPSEPRPITMRLVHTTPDEPAAEAEPVADPQPPTEPRIEQQTEAPTTPDAATRAPPAEVEPDRSPDPVADARQAPGIRARLLQQVAEHAETGTDRGATAPELPWTSSGEAVRDLPGVRGWLSGYVGRVEPSGQRWQSSDGARRARYVLADGTVICTRRRAPTIDEMMNPWKSIAVTMGSVCGRARPEAPDFSDPRIQPPPTARRNGD